MMDENTLPNIFTSKKKCSVVFSIMFIPSKRFRVQLLLREIAAYVEYLYLWYSLDSSFIATKLLVVDNISDYAHV